MGKPTLIKCPACLGDKHSNIGEKNNFFLWRCSICKTIFADIGLHNIETAKEVKELYEHYYDAAEFTLNHAAEISLQNIVSSFEKYRLTQKILDIGFGEGGLLTIAEKNEWKCYGTELSPHALEYGERRGWTVSDDVLNDSRFPQQGFDVVTMIELIEHVPNPDVFLQTAFKMLRSGGILFLTTPNTQGINRRLLGLEWSVVSPPEHITIWSSTGLEKALHRNKFVPKAILTEGLNPVEILGKLRRNKQEKNIHRNEAAFALNEAFTKNTWRRVVKTLINRGLSLFHLGDGIKIWAIKKN